MSSVSVVIVCRNEAGIIAKTLQSLEGLTDDVIVYDNGSTDGTQQVVQQFNVRLAEGSWEGFGKTKRKANELAKNDWILSLDADESLDPELKQSIRELDLGDNNLVYDLSFRNFIGDTYLKYGEWGRDHHIRIFNRRVANWNDAPVHENLVFPDNVQVRKLKGYVLHQTVKDMADYAQKTVQYAMLNADKYHRLGKRSSWFKIRLSPGFTFIHYYIIKLGFLDGHAGYTCAKMTAWYTFLKYERLRELWKN